jgi:hypothetical protein
MWSGNGRSRYRHWATKLSDTMGRPSYHGPIETIGDRPDTRRRHGLHREALVPVCRQMAIAARWMGKIVLPITSVAHPRSVQ